MPRFAHRIRENKVTELPHNCIWFDTETTPFEIAPGETGQRLNFGWACYQQRRSNGKWCVPTWQRFTKPLQFLKWIDTKTREKTRTYIFAHNYHFESAVLNLFYHLPKLGWENTRAIVESPPFILAWRKDKKTIEFLDTGNWWMQKAATIGESIGVEKLPFPDKDASQEVWDTYCKRDVEIIRQACLKWFVFIERYDLGGFARTLAGQSFRAFRHRFMTHDIFIDDHERADALGRESYHGGRTECFFIGKKKGPIHVYDINSMYPFVMRENDYPTKKVCYGRAPSLNELSKWLRDFCVVADVEIETKRSKFAYLYEHKIIFPIGRFRTVLVTPDISEALRFGEIRKCFALAAYEKAPLFRRFVDELYQLRLEAKTEGNEVMTYNLKIVLNSLYGKFGQVGRVWETIDRTKELDVKVWDEIDLETMTLYRWRQFGGIIQRRAEIPESYNSFPAIASHVTAYARDLLWRYFAVCGPQNVLYTDTDSLFVTNAGERNLRSLIHPTKLGALKHEKSFEWLEIFGPKDYRSNLGVVCKGVKASAKWLESNHVCQEEWKKLPGLLRRGCISTPIIIEREKTLYREYSKGTVLKSGKVKPYRLPM